MEEAEVAMRNFEQAMTRLRRDHTLCSANAALLFGSFRDVTNINDRPDLAQQAVEFIRNGILPSLLTSENLSDPFRENLWYHALHNAGFSSHHVEQLFAAWGELMMVETVKMTRRERLTWLMKSPRYSTLEFLREFTSDDSCSYAAAGSLWRVVHTLFGETLSRSIITAKSRSKHPSSIIFQAYLHLATPDAVTFIVPDMQRAFPDLADLPEKMLFDVVVSQPFPADWYRDVMMMPDDLVWVDPQRKVGEVH